MYLLIIILTILFLIGIKKSKKKDNKYYPDFDKLVK